MALLDSVLNNVSVGSGSSTVASTGSSGVPGSGDAIAAGSTNKIDVSFLDSLYAGGKLTPANRDAILAGSDPSVYGLSQYDLYYLTVGRLGSKSALPAACFSLIVAWSATSAYQAGQIVTYQPVGAAGVQLYQASVLAPAGTLPTNTTYWVQLTGSQALLDVDLVNPALASVAAPGTGVLALQNTSGTVLGGIIVPAGRAYRINVSEVRPNARGSSMAVDANVRLVPLVSEQLNGDGSVTVTITPRWSQVATANNASIAAVALGNLASHLTVTLQ